ncbi:MAG: hypothetical protein ACHP7K_05205 [Actinomycetales bacterium]
MADRPAGDQRTYTALADLPVRGRARCQGYIVSATIPPATGAPQFAVIVTDVDFPHDDGGAGAARKAGPAGKAAAAGTTAPDKPEPARPSARKANRRIRLVWLGRRRVPGIEAGTAVRFEGMVSMRDGLPTMYNPRYEIIGKQES